MLGNFSFGDYFKEEAVAFAWEFFTDVVRLPEEKLWVTIYQNDDPAYDIWRLKIGVPEDRIVRFGEKDNFWSMGETGPCGPCSEIHIDRGMEYSCGKPDCGIACDCDRVLELWNLVFMQYNRDAAGTLTPLPRPSIDTGMGLERLAAVVQNVPTNFDTDLLLPTIRRMEEIAERPYGDDPERNVSFRVIADHVRAASFLIHDGVHPSNEGRGYVLRRIIRRALRHGKMLNVEGPFLHRLIGRVVETMGPAYPELADSEIHVARAVRAEEDRFSHTLDQGMRVLTDLVQQAREKRQTVLSGDDAFKLYDTYGFPLDLAQEISADAGLTIDLEGYHRAMTGQREKAKRAWKGDAGESVPPVYETLYRMTGVTPFTGYHSVESEASVAGMIKNGQPAESASAGEEVEIVLDRTPFYGESGGQVGDRGVLRSDTVEAEVWDVIKPISNWHVHKTRIKKGSLRVGDRVLARVERDTRAATMLNHSATHLLHAALRQVLGDHVKQAGSLVAPDRLRFDFTHFAATEGHELDRVEELVNEKIRENIAVTAEEMGLDDALEKGAIAFFGEKYGERVRVVEMGEFSKELCGGTHVHATGDIGFFIITHEGSVSAGVRRIEALTGAGACGHVKAVEDRFQEVRSILKSAPNEEPEKAKKLVDRLRELEKEIERLRDRMASGGGPQTESDAVQEIDGVKLLVKEIPDGDSKVLRTFIDRSKDRLKSGVVVAGAVRDGKVLLAAGVTKDLLNRLHAGDILKEAAVLVGGTGGGRPDMAQAGGKNPEGLSSALAKIPEIVRNQLQGGTG
jgi:alanyl-tRNA synthetase